MLREYCKEKNLNISDMKIAVQGFGNVGYHAARILEAEYGAKIVGVSNATGALFNPIGIDITKLKHHIDANRDYFDGFQGAEQIDRDSLLQVPCDVLIPAALSHAITPEVAEITTAKLVLEAANGPTTPEANEILFHKGVDVLPSILCNAGGVVVSYFEWVQNLQQFYWDYDTVVRELEKRMTKAYWDVADYAAQTHITYRQSAYKIALDRVAASALLRGF